ncbi:hypothetical protein CsSME_00007231 [Camellia sinensis var. sinensis]
MDTSNTIIDIHMDDEIYNQQIEIPNHDNNMGEMDSTGDNVVSEDSKNSDDSANSKDSEDSKASHVRSSFITSDNDDIDFAMMSQRTCPYTGEMYTEYLLNGHPRTIREILRMDAPTFRSLCAELKCRDFIKVEKNCERHRLAVDSLCRLAVLIIQPPDPNVIFPKIRNNLKRYPWFKGNRWYAHCGASTC